MARILYELAGRDEDRRFSPFAWRIRLALRHKGLAFEGIPWRMTDKAALAFSGQGKVPVLVDGETVVSDSWAIGEYLEATYPDRPSLFGGAEGKGMARFITDWVEVELLPRIFRMIALDIAACMTEQDAAYFRSSRETMVGMTLEAYSADRERYLPEFRGALAPLRRMLNRQPFIGGAAPCWPDFAVFAVFQWARSVSAFPLLAEGDKVQAWLERMLDAYDGEGRRWRAAQP